VALRVAYWDKLTTGVLELLRIETLVSDRLADEETYGVGKAERVARNRDRQIEALQQELRMALGTGVKIKKGAKDRGQIVITFRDGDEFERLRELLLGYPGPNVRKSA